MGRRPVQSLSVCTRVTFTFTLGLKQNNYLKMKEPAIFINVEHFFIHVLAFWADYILSRQVINLHCDNLSCKCLETTLNHAHSFQACSHPTRYVASGTVCLSLVLSPAVNFTSVLGSFNPLKPKRRPLYLKTQSVPRCKHFSSGL